MLQGLNAIQYKDPQDFIKENNLVVKSMGRHVQCVLNFEDNEDEDGGTILVPKFHKHIEQWCKVDADLVLTEEKLFKEKMNRDREQKNLAKKQLKELLRQQKMMEKAGNRALKEGDQSVVEAQPNGERAGDDCVAEGGGDGVSISGGLGKSEDSCKTAISSSSVVAHWTPPSADDGIAIVSLPMTTEQAEEEDPVDKHSRPLASNTAAVGDTNSYSNQQQENKPPRSYKASKSKSKQQGKGPKQTPPPKPAPVMSTSDKWGSGVHVQQPLPWLILSDDSELLALAQRVSEVVCCDLCLSGSTTCQ